MEKAKFKQSVFGRAIIWTPLRDNCYVSIAEEKTSNISATLCTMNYDNFKNQVGDESSDRQTRRPL